MKFQNVRRGHTVSSKTTAPRHAPQISDPRPLEVLTPVKETLSDVSNSNEEKANEDKDVDEEDLISLDEVVSAMLF